MGDPSVSYRHRCSAFDFPCPVLLPAESAPLLSHICDYLEQSYTPEETNGSCSISYSKQRSIEEQRWRETEVRL